MKRYGNLYDKICDIFSKYSLIRKKIKYNCVFKVKNRCSAGVLASYNGWLLMCDSYNLRKKYNI